MGRTQMVLVQLRPGIAGLSDGTVIYEDAFGSEVLGWVVTASDPIEGEQ